MTAVPPYLVVFDFDHTIVDDNSDTFIYSAAPSGGLPRSVQALCREGHWTEFMNDTFAHLHSQGVSTERMLDTLRGIPWTPGFVELLAYLRGNSQLFETIILSDSNTLFICEILSTTPDALGTFSAILTNAGVAVPDQPLHITPFHTPARPHTCPRCSHNLCKHAALTAHRARHAEGTGKDYERVFYVGDGGNDLCPSLGLGSGDVVFPRKGYALEARISKIRRDAGKRAQHQ
ncbi:MAG: hypothetical protein WDW38_000893 [Sanguina aurantia]